MAGTRSEFTSAEQRFIAEDQAEGQRAAGHDGSESAFASTQQRQVIIEIFEIVDQTKSVVTMEIIFCRSLEERERLTERVAYLDMRLQEKDEEMKVSMRRSQLENKSLRSQLHNEQAKVRDIQHKLDLSGAEVHKHSDLMKY